MLSPKELIKLAAACRKAGIKSYKTQDFEFTLTDDMPVKQSKNQQPTYKDSIQGDSVETDSLTQDQLLMWSAVSPEDEL